MDYISLLAKPWINMNFINCTLLVLEKNQVIFQQFIETGWGHWCASKIAGSFFKLNSYYLFCFVCYECIWALFSFSPLWTGIFRIVLYRLNILVWYCLGETVMHKISLGINKVFRFLSPAVFRSPHRQTVSADWDQEGRSEGHFAKVYFLFNEMNALSIGL